MARRIARNIRLQGIWAIRHLVIRRLVSHRLVIRGLMLALVGAAGLAASVPPARAADAQNGEKLAKRWCASCHMVETGQRAGSADTPPFSAIAARQDFTAAQVALFLLTPHPRMPDMSLSRAEAADLAAYIAAQRR